MKLEILTKLDDIKARPYRAHATDAGADLYSNSDITIYPEEQKLINTGVAVKIPQGYVGLVYNRSSQGKIRIVIPNSVGVIDSDYRGNIMVLLYNDGNDPYFIKCYDTRIAQLVIAPVILAEFKPWIGLSELWEETERGSGGFGSTNNK